MSISAMFDKNASIREVMDVAEANCTQCMCTKCNNVNCPNMRALMDVAEKKIMTTDEKKRYFKIVGG